MNCKHYDYSFDPETAVLDMRQSELLAKTQIITTTQDAIHAAAATAAGGQECLFYKQGSKFFLWDSKSGEVKQVKTEG